MEREVVFMFISSERIFCKVRPAQVDFTRSGWRQFAKLMPGFLKIRAWNA